MAHSLKNLIFHPWSMRMCLSVNQRIKKHGFQPRTPKCPTAQLPSTSHNQLVSYFSISSKLSENQSNDGLIITDACVKQIKKIQQDGEFLRVVVEGGGCSGFTYKFKLDTEIEEDDKIFEREGVRVVVDELSHDLIKGSEVDYAEELIRSAFRLNNNPQSKDSCSCGVSFSID